MSKKKSKDPYAAREAAKYERPIPSREFIAEHIKRRGQPATYAELLAELKLDDEEMQDALHRRIKAMIRDEQLERLRGGYFWPAGKRILVEGTVSLEKGRPAKTWVIPKDGSNRILLSLDDARAVYTGNRVIVSTIDAKEGEQPREGRLAEIIEQERIVVTGRFVQEAGFCQVIPHGKEVIQNILIPQGKENGASDGMIVVVALERQSTLWTEPVGHVLEVLGSENTPGIEIKAAMRAYNLPHIFPENILKETSQLSIDVPSSAKRGRLDLREVPLVTIDGEDAKDFDDAVFCEEKRDGGFRLTVAIADVSFYVRPGMALDAEAEKRGTSVYFPGEVIPMLPEILSNGLCSLNPDVDRLCIVCIMTINNQGKTTRYEFQEGIMRSHARLTYTKVAALLSEKNEKLKEQYAALLPHLQSLYKLYHVLKNAREKRGAIDFETVETHIIFGKDGKISRIEPVQRNDAHRLIEECMLSANVACARFLKKYKLPGLYRNHEGPPEEKLADLKVFLNELGLPLGGGTKPQPLDFAALLRSIQKRPDANIIQMVLLRSLSQAVYSKDNIGHFGLAYPAYCHFTSPIRRYPDLLVHRQIRMVLRGQWTEKKIEEANTEAFQESLVKLGDHTSTTERRADDATRDAVRWLKCQYIQKHLGEEFDGVISGVTRFGFFVELKDIYIDGLVHVTSLRNDYYYFDSIHHRLVGERSGIEYKLGGSVKVKVIKVDVDDRKIDFELLNVPETKTKKSRSGSKSKSKHGHDAKDFSKNNRNNKNRKNSKNKGKPGRHKHKSNAQKRVD